MGLAGADTCRLLNNSETPPTNKIPEDKWHISYIIFFILDLGYVLPWNAFITAVDYFSYLYPEACVDRIFADPFFRWVSPAPIPIVSSTIPKPRRPTRSRKTSGIYRTLSSSFSTWATFFHGTHSSPPSIISPTFTLKPALTASSPR